MPNLYSEVLATKSLTFQALWEFYRNNDHLQKDFDLANSPITWDQCKGSAKFHQHFTDINKGPQNHVMLVNGIRNLDRYLQKENLFHQPQSLHDQNLMHLRLVILEEFIEQGPSFHELGLFYKEHQKDLENEFDVINGRGKYKELLASAIYHFEKNVTDINSGPENWVALISGIYIFIAYLKNTEHALTHVDQIHLDAKIQAEQLKEIIVKKQKSDRQIANTLNTFIQSEPEFAELAYFYRENDNDEMRSVFDKVNGEGEWLRRKKISAAHEKLLHIGSGPENHAEMISGIKNLVQHLNNPRAIPLMIKIPTTSKPMLSAYAVKIEEQDWQVSFSTTNSNKISCKVKVCPSEKIFLEKLPVSHPSSSKNELMIFLAAKLLKKEMDGYQNGTTTELESAAIVSLVWKNIHDLHSAFHHPTKTIANLSEQTTSNAKESMAKSDIAIVDHEGVFFSRITDKYLDNHWLIGQHIPAALIKKSSHEIHSSAHDTIHKIASFAENQSQLCHLLGGHVPKIIERILFCADASLRAMENPNKNSAENITCGIVGTSTQTLSNIIGFFFLEKVSEAGIALAPETGGLSLFAIPLAALGIKSVDKMSRYLGNMAQQSCHDFFQFMNQQPQLPASIQENINLLPGLNKKSSRSSHFIIGKSSDFDVRRLSRPPKNSTLPEPQKNSVLITQKNQSSCGKLLLAFREERRKETLEQAFKKTISIPAIITKPLPAVTTRNSPLVQQSSLQVSAAITVSGSFGGNNLGTMFKQQAQQVKSDAKWLRRKAKKASKKCSIC